MPPTGTVRVANWTIQWNLKRLRCVDMSSDGLWREIALQNLEARCEAAGQWRLPCVSAALENYVKRLVGWFTDLGKPLQFDEITQLRQTLGKFLEEGFQLNPGANLLVKYDLKVEATLRKSLALNIAYVLPNLAEEYTHWAQGNDKPLFGTHPDARVLHALVDLGIQESRLRVLDVGAGDGRNAIPLAKRGCAVDTLELTPALAERLRRVAAAQNADIQVFVGDLFDRSLALNPEGYHLVILSGVASHFRSTAQLRQWLERLCNLLVGGGQCVMNIFLTDPGYRPDELVRQLSQAAWSSVFTPEELREAMAGLPLHCLSDDPVWEYERQHLPPAAWPPSPWFETWTQGRGVLPTREERPPFQMHWIALSKT